MASQLFWFKIVGTPHEADVVHYAEDDIVAIIKHKIIRQNPGLNHVNPGQLTVKAASGEAAAVGHYCVMIKFFSLINSCYVG